MLKPQLTFSCESFSSIQLLSIVWKVKGRLPHMLSNAPSKMRKSHMAIFTQYLESQELATTHDLIVGLRMLPGLHSTTAILTKQNGRTIYVHAPKDSPIDIGRQQSHYVYSKREILSPIT